MHNEHQQTASRVAGVLVAGENAIDLALANVSRLSGHVATARVSTGTPFGTGQGAMDDIVKALDLMMRARHHVARAHERLREASVPLGVDITAFGDVVPCPNAAALPEAEAPRLRLVG